MVTVRSWGTNPRLLVEHQFLTDLFFLGPLALMLAMMIGQTNHRAGLRTWQTLSRRSFWSVAALPLRVALLANVLPIAAVALCFIACAAWTAQAHGVDATTLGHELLASTDSFLWVVAVTAVNAAVGVLLGAYLRSAFLIPLAGVLAFAANFVLPAPAPQIDSDYAETYGYHLCAEDSPRVCASEPNAPYLEGAAEALHQAYAEAPQPTQLPHTIYVVNEMITATSPILPAVSLEGLRSWNGELCMDVAEARQQLIHALYTLCPGNEDAAYAVLDSYFSEENPGTDTSELELCVRENARP